MGVGGCGCAHARVHLSMYSCVCAGADPDPKAEGCEDETYIFSFAVVNQRHSMLCVLLYNIIITHSTKMSSMISYTLNVKIYK